MDRIFKSDPQNNFLKFKGLKMQKEKTVRPGMNPRFVQNHFTNDEKTILDKLAKHFYLTNGGKEISIANAQYRYCLLKFTDERVQLFGINFEIIVLFSSYPNFEPRTLDAIEKIEEEIGSRFRVDKICAIVISKCENFLEQLNQIFTSNKESRVIIPFTYNELTQKQEATFFNQRIKRYFFQQNLFDYQAPLTKDLYFFGRNHIVHTLINKHEQKEIAGIFGLRKSGKTSILYAVRRELKQKGGYSVLIDCQALYQGSWNMALYRLVDRLNKELFTKIDIVETDYEANRAHISFSEDIRKIYRKLGKRFLIIFDEIEHLTYGVSANDAWRNGRDYLFFWHIIRSSFQEDDGNYTFMLSGTNPKCIEIDRIDGTDNPLFQQFQPIYLEGFTLEDTEQMVSTLAKYMCISFDKEIYTYLTDNLGGHPFLIRQMCSFLFKQIKNQSDIQINIDKDFYTSNKEKFESDDYCQMIIGVLKDSYHDEYEMLGFLARGDIDSFQLFADSDGNYIKHILGYGIVRKSPHGEYKFNIEIIKKYLEKGNKYQRLYLSQEERRNELSERRNKLELNLRSLIQKMVLEEYGRKTATDKLNAIFHTNFDKSQYSDFFDPKKNSKLYFITLKEIIIKPEIWRDCFKDKFNSQQNFISRMDLINNIHLGRADAHAADITDADFKTIRGALEYFEDFFAKFKL